MSLSPMFQRALAVTRRIHRNQLYQWLIAASLILDSGGGGVGAGSYNTIATGAVGSGRLLDISAATLSGLQKGSEAFVSSVLSYFRWNPTSTAVADNIAVVNPLVNGVNPGRFEREAIPALEWATQAAWFIDPANTSTVASDENSGLTALLPLRTPKELMRRIGGQQLQQSTTATYLSSGTITNADHQLSGVVIVGLDAGFTLAGVPTQFGGASFFSANVDAINRAAGTDATEVVHDATANFATAVGKFIVTTGAGAAGGKFARVLANVGGVAANVAPFVKFVDIDTAPALAALPATNDTYQIVDLPVVPIGTFEVRQASAGSIGAPKKNVFFLDSVNVAGGATGFGSFPNSGLFARIAFYAKMCLFTNCEIDTKAPGWATGLGCGFVELVGLASDDPDNFGSYFPAWCACSAIGGGEAIIRTGTQSSFALDTVFYGATLLVDKAATAFGSRVALFVSGGLLLSTGAQYISLNQFGLDGAANLLYGNNVSNHAINIGAGAAVYYNTKPTANSTLGAGRYASVGGTDKQSAAVPYAETAAFNLARMAVLV